MREPGKIDHSVTRDSIIREFAVSESFCLRVFDAQGLVERIAEVIGPWQQATNTQAICEIRVDRHLPEGVRIDFDHFAPGCTLDCSPSVAVAELLPWINLLLPTADLVSMHASAFTWKDKGVAVTGSASSGKTGILLAAAQHGGGTVGDECLWLDPVAKLRGIMVDMEIRADYFRELPHLRTEISPLALNVIFLCDMVGRTLRSIQPRLARKFNGRARAHVRPDIVKRHLVPANLERLYISEIHPGSAIRVDQTDLTDAVARLVEIQRREFSRQYDLYAQYCAAGNERSNAWMNSFPQQIEQLFGMILENTECYILERPESVRAQDLFFAITDSWS